MSFAINPRGGLVLVRAELQGPAAVQYLRLALDTAATTTMIGLSYLTAAGYTPGMVVGTANVTTGGGVQRAPVYMVSRLRALGHVSGQMPVTGLTLPPGA